MCIYCTSSFYVWSVAGGVHQIGCSHLTKLHFACIWQQSSRRITSSVPILLLQSYIFILFFQLWALYRLHKEKTDVPSFLVSPTPDSPGWLPVPPSVQGPQKDPQMWGGVHSLRTAVTKQLSSEMIGKFYSVSKDVSECLRGKRNVVCILKQQGIQELNENDSISSEASCSPTPSEEESLKDIQTEFKAFALVLMKHREGGRRGLWYVFN